MWSRGRASQSILGLGPAESISKNYSLALEMQEASRKSNTIWIDCHRWLSKILAPAVSAVSAVPATSPRSCSVVDRMIRIRQIKDNRRMWLRATAVGKLLGKVDRAVEAQTAVVVEVDVQRLEVSRGVDDTDLAGLDEVIGDLER